MPTWQLRSASLPHFLAHHFGCTPQAQTLTGRAKGVLRNGCYFDADFFHGRMHGQGQMHWPDGQKYEGQFVHNWMEGRVDPVSIPPIPTTGSVI